MLNAVVIRQPHCTTWFIQFMVKSMGAVKRTH